MENNRRNQTDLNATSSQKNHGKKENETRRYGFSEPITVEQIRSIMRCLVISHYHYRYLVISHYISLSIMTVALLIMTLYFYDILPYFSEIFVCWWIQTRHSQSSPRRSFETSPRSRVKARSDRIYSSRRVELMRCPCVSFLLLFVAFRRYFNPWQSSIKQWRKHERLSPTTTERCVPCTLSQSLPGSLR
jgi:hypothetical protein